MNWLDAVIAAGLLLFIIAGFRRGFLIGLVELAGIVVSVGIPLILYLPGSRVLEGWGIPQVYSGALAFVIIFFIVSSLFFTIANKIYRWIPHQLHALRLNQFFGLLTGLLKGLVAITILIALIVSFPLPFITSDHVEQSYLGSPLLDTAVTVTSLTSHIFGEAFQHAIGFLTIETEVGETIDLRFTVADPEINQEAEREMLRLVNEERALEGLPELVLDETLRDVARQYSVDMLQRGYMGHIDPEDNTPFDRMRDGGVTFTTAGENLALAQTVSIAHKGLMDSPGHRANILSPHYSRVGIGAAQGGSYGTMFTQKFAD
ncbi:MAG: CvpA family protein [Bacillota bacterium]